MKYFMALVLLTTVVLKAFAKEVVWEVQSYKPSNSFMHQNFLKYAVLPINKELEGRLRIDLIPQESNFRISGIHNSFVALKFDQIDGMFTTPIYWGNFDPVFSIVGDMVAAWPSPEGFDTWLAQAGFDFINLAYKEHGMISLGYTLRPHESLVSKFPIRSLDDLKGKVIRVPSGGMQRAYFKKIGAVPKEISVDNVKNALQSGIVDIADYNIVYINSLDGFYKVVKHTNYKGFHSAPMIEFVVSRQKWDELSRADQDTIKKHLKNWKLRSMLDVKNKTYDSIRSLKRSGVKFYSWSDDELQKAREIAVSVWDDYALKSERSKQVVESIKSYLKSSGYISNNE